MLVMLCLLIIDLLFVKSSDLKNRYWGTGYWEPIPILKGILQEPKNLLTTNYEIARSNTLFFRCACRPSSDYKKEAQQHKSSRDIVAPPRRPGFDSDSSRRLVASVSSSSSREPWASKERDRYLTFFCIVWMKWISSLKLVLMDSPC